VNSLNFCKIYEQVLIFFLLLPLSVLWNAAHRPSPAFSLAASCPFTTFSCATWPPACPPAAQPTPLAPPRTDASRCCLPEPPCAPSTARSCLPPAHTPLFSLGTCPVNFSYSLLRSTTSLELFCSPPSAVSATSPLQFRAPPTPPRLIAPS
jgi:hypothetical protein